MPICDGKKRCGGPLHKGEMLPLSQFYYYRRSKEATYRYSSYCKRCLVEIKGYDSSYTGLVGLKVAYPVFLEIENRLGRVEAARTIGMTRSNFAKIVDRQRVNVRGKTFAKALFALEKVRKENKVRHKKDIRYGSAARGLPERVPKHRRDYYHSSGDEETQEQRRRRHKQTETISA